jgi:hypothetical protein
LIAGAAVAQPGGTGSLPTNRALPKPADTAPPAPSACAPGLSSPASNPLAAAGAAEVLASVAAGSVRPSAEECSGSPTGMGHPQRGYTRSAMLAR